MTLQITELIDLKQLELLLQSLHTVTGMSFGLVDNDGNILVSVGHQRICSEFHRAHPAALELCVESDRNLIAQAWDGPHYCPRCPHGLTYCGTPVIVEGEPLAYIFMGQLLTEAPDMAFFQRQAETFGFDEASYFDAVSKVPILPAAQIAAVLDFVHQLGSTLATNGINRLRQLQATDALRTMKRQLENEVQERKLAEADARDYSERLELLTRRSLNVQEAEQRRLATELHDRVSSNLSMICMELSDVYEDLRDTVGRGAIEQKLSDCIEMLKQTLLSTRDISSDLHPSLLEIGGLLPALEGLAENFQKATDMAVEVFASGQRAILPKDKRIALFRIVQEALVNCAKHARCSVVFIHLDYDVDGIRLSIKDDGVGFNPVTVYRSNGHAGLGLFSMRERAASIGGECLVESVPGEGTHVSLRVPGPFVDTFVW